MKAHLLIAGAMTVLVAAAMPALADAIGSGPNGDLFTLNFDEHGNGTVPSCSIGPCSFTGNDPGYIDANGFLAYNLPQLVSTGDVAIRETNGTVGDGLRFLTLASSPSGYAMEFYSTDSFGALADTGLPPNFNTSFVGATEAANGSFVYNVGNVYNGVSDEVAVPVPKLGWRASLLILAVGLLGLEWTNGRRVRSAADA